MADGQAIAVASTASAQSTPPPRCPSDVHRQPHCWPQEADAQESQGKPTRGESRRFGRRARLCKSQADIGDPFRPGTKSMWASTPPKMRESTRQENHSKPRIWRAKLPGAPSRAKSKAAAGAEARSRVESAATCTDGLHRPRGSSGSQFLRPSPDHCWQKPRRILNWNRPSVVAGDPTLSEREISCRSASGLFEAIGWPIASV